MKSVNSLVLDFFRLSIFGLSVLGLSVLGLSVLALSVAVGAADEPKPHLVMKANKAQEQAQKTEAEQLEKAKAAVTDTAGREAEVLQRQQNAQWQDEQRNKASAQFNERENREKKYLREAKEAAKQEQKIPKP